MTLEGGMNHIHPPADDPRVVVVCPCPISKLGREQRSGSFRHVVVSTNYSGDTHTPIECRTCAQQNNNSNRECSVMMPRPPVPPFEAAVWERLTTEEMERKPMAS